MRDEYIYIVDHIVKVGNFLIRCRCPHCQNVIDIEVEELTEWRGNQYECRCGGWLEVSNTAAALNLDDELPGNKGYPNEK